MFGKAKIQNSNVRKRKSPEFQFLELSKFLTPMFRKANNKNFNVWNS